MVELIVFSEESGRICGRFLFFTEFYGVGTRDAGTLSIPNYMHMRHIFFWAAALLFLSACGPDKKDKTDPAAGASPNSEKSGEPAAADQVTGSQVEKAREYAMGAQMALGKTLKQKIAEAGPEAAIGFCSERAFPITDSVARSYGVAIQRVSNRARNPLNRASEAEEAIMSAMSDSLEAGATITPRRVEDEGTHYYFPIQTNALCMNCHGIPEEEIRPGVLRLIRETYPEDEAVGYRSDQLRGLWKISFETQTQEQEP